MKIENLVVGLETAKELQEKLASVGIVPFMRTLLWWKKRRALNFDEWGDWYVGMDYFTPDDRWKCLPAPTLEDMLDIFPPLIEKDDKKYTWTVSPEAIYYSVPPAFGCSILEGAFFEYKPKVRAGCEFSKDNKATAAAKLMIHLIYNGYIKKLDK